MILEIIIQFSGPLIYTNLMHKPIVFEVIVVIKLHTFFLDAQDTLT